MKKGLKYTVVVELPEGMQIENLTEDDVQHFGQFNLIGGVMKPNDPFYDQPWKVVDASFVQVENNL